MQLTTLERENTGKPLVEGKLTAWLRDLVNPLLLKVAKSAVTFQIVVENDYVPLSNRPIIFAGNHYCGQDIPIVSSVVKGRPYVLAAKQSLTSVDEFFFNLNGTIFLDRKDPEDRKASKRAMVQTLRNNRNIVMFPEGTSNISDALLMYPMKWGIIDIAKEAHAQIITVNLDYDKKAGKCYVNFGKPMIFDGGDKINGITLLRDQMASARWEYIERYPMVKRSQLNLDKEREKHRELLLAYKKLDFAYECSVVYRPEPDWDTVWEPVRNIRGN